MRIFCVLLWMSLGLGMVKAEQVYDAERDRHIPLKVYHPVDGDLCTIDDKCQVAFVSAGYGMSHLDYQFLVSTLSQQNFLTVAVGHELPGDPPLARKGKYLITRAENWDRGVKTLEFLVRQLSQQYPAFDFSLLTLVGHSNGGDISAWMARSNPEIIRSVVTLDHRRVPLPRSAHISVLSVRATDFPADPDVLFTSAELREFSGCIVEIPDSKHNDMSDYGPELLRMTIQRLLSAFLEGQDCQRIIEHGLSVTLSE